MPQFWIEDFMPQLFWLAVSFAVLYLLMSRFALPRITDVLEQRQDRIASDLDKAEEFKSRAEQTLAEYEAALAEARAEAQAQLAEQAARAAAEAERRSAEVAERLAHEAAEAAQRIAASKAEALEEVRGLSAELASAAVERLIGLKVSPSETAAAVDAALAEHR